MNAKEELIDEIKDSNSSIKCAKLECGKYYKRKSFVLRCGYSNEELQEFYRGIEEFGYDDGCGGRKLDGTVWLNDGTWLKRCYGYGFEWWEHKNIPEIPKELISQ